MAKNLVIVESPAKAKTIKKYLGKDYEVVASNGHVRDLPKSQLGIDIDNNFEPKYITIRGKGDILSMLRKEVKKADKVYLATDPDREGEAISYHLAIALKLENKNYKRITFNEITKTAVKNSIKNAREIDMNLVDAQQARRVLDRMVGYLISPLLWAKVKRGLSAGRVQSVALKMICDRENEINAFIPEEYWSLEAKLKRPSDKKSILFKYSGELKNEAETNKVIADTKDSSYIVSEVKTGERVKKAPLPFTTSTLQQEASSKLGFAPAKTMRIAQQLYEGVELGKRGLVALITYLRTDSIRISEDADKAAREFVQTKYGEQYVSTEERDGNKGKRIQDAHEAIRPTDVSIEPSIIKDTLSKEQFKLYQLIYNRFIASRMQSAVYTTYSVTATNNGHKFKSSTSEIKFDGFLSCYNLDEEKESNKSKLQNISKDDEFNSEELIPKQHFTQPPSHYTEALLIRSLEEQGIGRPSTYAPTITTLTARRYIVKENKNLFVTDLGDAVNSIMEKAFSVIIDKSFTANLESLFDTIEEGVIDWKVVIANFYPDLDEAVKNAEEVLENIEIADEESDEICDVCGRKMVIKYGPHGKFLACPGFPECKNTKPYFEKIGVDCPKCGKEIVVRKTKKGRRYYGCINIPDCDFMSWSLPTNEKCPECGSYMVDKGSKLLCSNDSCGFVKDKPKD